MSVFAYSLAHVLKLHFFSHSLSTAISTSFHSISLLKLLLLYSNAILYSISYKNSLSSKVYQWRVCKERQSFVYLEQLVQTHFTVKTSKEE